MPLLDTDWVLVALLDGISGTQGRMPLTVFSGGIAVSGIAVSEEVYFETVGLPTLAEHLAEDRQQKADRIAKLNVELQRENLSEEARRSLLERADELERKYIVMVDVTIYGAGPVPFKASAWRGRLSQMSSWVDGAYEAPDNPDA